MSQYYYYYYYFFFTNISLCRGFLRSDKLLAQASLKLADLETKCEIHESLPVSINKSQTFYHACVCHEVGRAKFH